MTWAGFRRGRRTGGRAFTIIELLVAMTVLILIVVLVLSVITQASSVWRRSNEGMEAFQSARLGFDLITRNLSQATLNTYLDYDNATNPTRYLRKSELAYLSAPAGGTLPGTAGTGDALFFQAPASYTTNDLYKNMESLLNTCGYFVSFTTNSSLPTHVAASGNANPYRYRLMQLLTPTEADKIYDSGTGTAWFNSYTGPNYVRPVADNVIALVIRPQDPAAVPPASSDILTNSYIYDTRANTLDSPQPVTAHQLPPVVQVTMVAIDETAAKRLDKNDGSQPSEITAALSGKFQDPSAFDIDLKQLESALNVKRIGYRVFSSAVPIRESKWTK